MIQVSPPIAIRIATPKSEYICMSTEDCVPVTGSTIAPKEKPIRVSSSAPATCRAANIAASA